MNIDFKKQLKIIEKKFNDRSVRERVLMGCAFLFLLWFFWYNVVYGYLLATDEEVKKNLDSIKSQISQLETQIDLVSEVVGRNPTATLVQEANQLRKANEVLNQTVSNSLQKLVPAQDMDEMLHNIIEKMVGLKVIGIENLPVEVLVDAPTLTVGNNTLPGLKIFSHVLKLELFGGYFDTLNFLKSIEKEKLNIIWDSLSYEVIKYPNAKITIQLKVLSLSEESFHV